MSLEKIGGKRIFLKEVSIKLVRFRVSANASPKLDQVNFWQQIDWSQLLMDSNLGKTIEVVREKWRRIQVF